MKREVDGTTKSRLSFVQELTKNDIQELEKIRDHLEELLKWTGMIKSGDNENQLAQMMASIAKYHTQLSMPSAAASMLIVGTGRLRQAKRRPSTILLRS